MRPIHTALSRSVLIAALGLVLGSVACIQPNEQSDSRFGTFVGNAVAADDADAATRSGDESQGSNGSAAGGAAGSATAGGNSAGGLVDAGNTSSNAGGDNPSDPASADPTGGASAGGQGTTAGDAAVGTTGADPGGTSSLPAEVSSLTFSVLTKSLGGQYSPRNVGAIWITNDSGAFVKTLELWANQRLQYLTTFQAQTNRNKVDAVTSATLSSHKTHTVTWNLKDLSGNVVPDGKYNIVIETTDKNGFGDSVSLPFTKGSAPVQLSPANATHYVNMAIDLK